MIDFLLSLAAPPMRALTDGELDAVIDEFSTTDAAAIIDLIFFAGPSPRPATTLATMADGLGDDLILQAGPIMVALVALGTGRTREDVATMTPGDLHFAALRLVRIQFPHLSLSECLRAAIDRWTQRVVIHSQAVTHGLTKQ